MLPALLLPCIGCRGGRQKEVGRGRLLGEQLLTCLRIFTTGLYENRDPDEEVDDGEGVGVGESGDNGELLVDEQLGAVVAVIICVDALSSIMSSSSSASFR